MICSRKEGAGAPIGDFPRDQLVMSHTPLSQDVEDLLTHTHTSMSWGPLAHGPDLGHLG